MKMTATIKIEFEATPGSREGVLRHSLTRGLCALSTAIEDGVGGGRRNTGIRECSTKWEVIEQEIT
jgi:hypothetical protein